MQFVSNDSLFLSTCSTFTYISIYLPWSVINYRHCRQEKNLLCHFLHLSLFVFYCLNWTDRLTALFPDFMTSFCPYPQIRLNIFILPKGILTYNFGTQYSCECSLLSVSDQKASAVISK